MSTTEHVVTHSSDDQIAGTGTGLVDFARVWRLKWCIAGCLALSLAAGVTYLQRATPLYSVGARVLLQCAPGSLDVDTPARVDPRFVATQAEIIRSPAVVERAMRAAATAGPPGAATTDAADFSVAVEQAVHALNVVPVGSTSVLQISLRGASAPELVHLVGAIIDSYVSFTNEMQHGDYSETLRLLTEREATLRDELGQLESRFEEMRAGNELFGEGKEAFAVHRTLLEGISQRLSETRIHRIDAENQLRGLAQARPWPTAVDTVALTHPPRQEAGAVREPARVRTTSTVSSAHIATSAERDAQLAAVPLATRPAPDGNGPQPAAPAQLPGAVAAIDEVTIQQRIWDAESRALDLGKVYGPQHPEMRAVQQQITLWKQILEDVRQEAPRAMAGSLEVLTSTERYLDKQYAQAFADLKSLDLALLQEQRAMENIRRVQAIHHATLEQIEGLKLTSQALADGRPLVTVRKLDGPEPVTELVWPRTSQVLALTSLVGLLCGFVVLVAVDHRVIRLRR